MAAEKDAQIPLTQELRETCDRLLEQVQSYRYDLEHELAQVKSESDPYIHHIRALEHLLPRVRQLEDLVVGQVFQAAQEIIDLDSRV